MQASYISIITAVFMGFVLGFILQRGRFCLNSAFRDIIFLKQYTMLRAYLLCIVVAIVGSNILDDFGLLTYINEESGELVRTSLLRQKFLPVANFVGGFIFGLGIVLAGGCASGIVYRLGEGQISAIIATIGFFLGIVMTLNGVLNPLYVYLKSFSVTIGGKANPALWDLFGGGRLAKWGTILVFSLSALTVVAKGKPTLQSKMAGYSWATTGVMIGLVTVVAWWISCFFGGGVPRGLAISTPLREMFYSILYRTSYSPFHEYSFLGIFKGTWGVFFIFAIPLGSFVSAHILDEFRWKIPPPGQFMTVFFGSIMMGSGAVIAGGCNLGHGVTGISTMALSSFVAISAIILGNWTMVYFKFIRMYDRDDF